jgi:hypothetical protein
VLILASEALRDVDWNALWVKLARSAQSRDATDMAVIAGSTRRPGISTPAWTPGQARGDSLSG